MLLLMLVMLQEVQPSQSTAQQAEAFNSGTYPPDQALCVGGGFVIELVNSYAIARDAATGAPASQPTALRGLFGAVLPSHGDIFDPRCEHALHCMRWCAWHAAARLASRCMVIRDGVGLGCTSQRAC